MTDSKPQSQSEMEEAMKSHEKWKTKRQLKFAFIMTAVMIAVVLIMYLVTMSRF